MPVVDVDDIAVDSIAVLNADSADVDFTVDDAIADFITDDVAAVHSIAVNSVVIPTLADSDSIDSVADNSVAVNSLTISRKEEVGKCFPIVPSVVLRKRGILVRGEKGDVCACCSLYNCFEGRDFCLNGCVRDCYKTWEGRERIKREMNEERIRGCEEKEDRDEERIRECEEKEDRDEERRRRRERTDSHHPISYNFISAHSSEICQLTATTPHPCPQYGCSCRASSSK